MSLMAGLARQSRGKDERKVMELKNIVTGLNSGTLLIIKFPDSRALRVLSRSLFLAVIILALPSIRSILKGSSNSFYDDPVIESDITGLESLSVIFRDLAVEGLLRNGDKGLIVLSSFDDLLDELQFFYDNDVDLVMEFDLDRQSLIRNGTFDYVITSSFQDTDFIDRVLKVGGMVITLLGGESSTFPRRLNYKLVYLRQFDGTIVAMRKTGLVVGGYANSPTKQAIICGFTPEYKKTALEGLEDVMLEPPRKGSENPIHRHQTKKMKFLPDLLGDSLEGYRRRVFITDEKKTAVEWFFKNYPTRNQHFDVYYLEADSSYLAENEPVEMSPSIGISEWLIKNARKEEDYVVMKAEAQLVEELIEEKAICLVDELLLECEYQWDDEDEDDGGGKEENEKRRAYWQCLALYGRLRDEGVAVHQWWG